MKLLEILLFFGLWLVFIFETSTNFNATTEKINNLELQITANHLEALTLIANKHKTKVDVLRSIKKTRTNLKGIKGDI